MEGHRNMAGRKKEVDDNFETLLKDFSNQYFDKELQHAHELFSDASWPKDEDPHYVKKATFHNCSTDIQRHFRAPACNIL